MWSIGAETQDRNYTYYPAWQSYLPDYGATSARLQGGWARCDPNGTGITTGVYNWAWLDDVVDDMLSNSVVPWIQTSFGNPAIPGGGNPSVASKPPSSPAALAAWDAWVTALVTRYGARGVTSYEIYNEPNCAPDITPQEYAPFAARTAAVISAVDSAAEIRLGAVCGVAYSFVAAMLPILQAAGTFALPNPMVVTYHPYDYNPDDEYETVAAMAALVSNYSTPAGRLHLIQGENGAPSVPFTYGALGDYNWTECSQAKWFTRRIGHDSLASAYGSLIGSSIFSAIDLCYISGNGSVDINTKGLLAANCPAHTVNHVKQSYGVVARLFSTLTHALPPMAPGAFNLTIHGGSRPYGWAYAPRSNVSAAGAAALPSLLLTLWDGSDTPTNADNTSTTLWNVTVTLPAGLHSALSTAAASGWVVVDTMNGNAFSVPADAINTSPAPGGGLAVTVTGVPVSDYVTLLGDAALLNLTTPVW